MTDAEKDTALTAREKEIGEMSRAELIDAVLGYSGMLVSRWKGDTTVWALDWDGPEATLLTELGDCDLRNFLEQRAADELE